MASKTLTEVAELAKIVQTLAPKAILEWSEKSISREARIYRHVVASQVSLSEKEIARAQKMDDREFQKSLSALKARLLDAITGLVLPESSYSDYARRLFALDVAHSRLRILQRLGATYTANEEARYWFEEAKKLEEWHLAVSLLSPLLNWTSLSGDKAEYDCLSMDRPRLLRLAAALADANETFERVRLAFAKSGTEHPELLEILRPAIERLQPIAREHGTFRLNEFLLLLRRKAQQVTTDYDEALAICEEMDALLVQYPLFANRSRKSRNALAKLVCFVQRERLEEAKHIAESSIDLFDMGDQDWHTFQSWRFLLFMRREQFGAGYELVQAVIGSSFFPSQTEATRDLWKLFRGYAEIMTSRPVTGANFRRNEKPGELHRRLMEEFPSFKGDYAGYEMAAIALEILIVLKHHVADLFLRTEALRKYKVRHIAPDTQSSIFIDLLELLETYDTDKPRIKQIAAPMVKRMVGIKTIDRIQAQQVMPYEMLWREIERLFQ